MPIGAGSSRPQRKVVQRVINQSIGYVGALNVQLSAGRGEDEVCDPRLEVQTSHGGSIGLSKTYAERYGHDDASGGPYENIHSEPQGLPDKQNSKQRFISSIQISNKAVGQSHPASSGEHAVYMSQAPHGVQ